MTLKPLNHLLVRQISQLGASPSTPPASEGWQNMLEQVSTTYDARDSERELTERSMEVAAREMQTLYEMLSQERDSLENRVLERTTELVSSEARFRALTSLSSDWFWEQDDQFRITMLTSSSGNRMGLNEATMLGLAFWEIENIELIDGSWQEYRLKFERREGFSGLTCRYTTEDASIGFITASGEPMFDTLGEFSGYRGVARDITFERRTQDHIFQLAHFDTLTGLMNRGMLNDNLSRHISHAERNQLHLAVLFIDLDGFKEVNDTHSHAAGDFVLKEIALRLRSAARREDIVARLGGDEFVIVLSDTNAETAENVSKRMLHEIAQPMTSDEATFQLRASIGISMYPEDGQEAKTLVQNADLAMYRAKGADGNRTSFFSQDLQSNAQRRLHIATGLRQAIAERQFKLFWQPKIDSQTRQVSGAEALLRWFHPIDGMIGPVVFIPIAEESGLIVPIGRWVILEACQQIKRWSDQGLSIRAAINVSARQFREDSFTDDVKTCLQLSQCDPSLLEIELTESMVMHDPERVVGILRELKTLGIHISLDDFGTGHSSLAWLRRFPIDTIKIDRSFINQLPGDQDDLAICKAVIALADSLGLETVAEGVETLAQADLLAQIGCKQLQGFYFFKPMPVDEVTPHLLQAFEAALDIRR